MLQIERAMVTPIRLVDKGNIIICKRHTIDLGHLSQQVEQSVANKNNENNIHADRIFGLKIIGKPWRRAVLKFTKNDGKKVIQLIDESGMTKEE